MKKTLLILAFALIQLTTLAQAPAIQWQKCMGGTGNEYSQSIKPTPDGGYIVAGCTGSNNGDVAVNHGGYDVWVVKIAAIGTIEWQKTFGGSNDEYAQEIQFTPDGGYIVAGYTGSIDGDVTGNHGYTDFWVVKLSATGDLIWQKVLGGTNDEQANSIQISSDGGYIIAGFTNSTDGDVTGNHGSRDAWIVKLTATGTLVWQKTLGGSYDEEAYSIKSTSDGNYIVSGYTNSINGDVIMNHGYEDAWVVKLDATGALVWQNTLGGTGSDFADYIQTTPDGGYILVGSTSSNDGDATGFHGGFSDAWIVKLSATGTLVWQNTVGGTGYEFFLSIQYTADGGYILGGTSTSNNGDVATNHGSEDAWIMKLSANGILVWQKSIGGTDYDRGNNIQLTSDGGYIFAGNSSSSNGDVTGNHGGSDVWVVKLGTDLAITGFSENAVVVYPNPASTLLTVKNNSNTSIDSITITDIMGKVVLTQKTSNTNSINVASLACGTYLLEATSGKDQFTSKFVKE